MLFIANELVISQGTIDHFHPLNKLGMTRRMIGLEVCVCVLAHERTRVVCKYIWVCSENGTEMRLKGETITKHTSQNCRIIQDLYQWAP
jgi:hypothetical protein